MWSRVGSRGLPIVLGFVVLLLASPTPVPRHAVLAWTTARLAAASGDTASAEQALRNLQLSSAWRAALKADTIRLALSGRNGEQALALLESDPVPLAHPAAVKCWRAEALALLGRWELAIETLSSSEGSGCLAPLPLLKTFATQAIESGDLQQAAAVLRQLVALNPQDVETASLLGACLTFEDPAAALAALRIPAARGDSLALDLTAALDDALPADRSAMSAATGQVFLRHRMWPLAAQAFRRLVALEPMNSSAHAYYGLALEQSGDAGLPELEAAAHLDPESSLAQSLLGWHWQQQGEPQRGIPYLERAVALEPENSAFLASLAAAQAGTGNVQAALAGYRRAADLQPANPIFWRLLAGFSIVREIELAETGLPAARNAVVLDLEDPAASDLLGFAHFLLADRVAAERLLVRSVQLDPTSVSARLHYGLLLSSAGRTKEARAHLAAAVGLGGMSPTGQLAQRALLRLGD